MSRHTKIRKCIACGERRSEIELIKIVKNKDQVKIDPAGDLPGREVYLCPSDVCIEKAKDNELLSDALKTSITDDLYNKIMEEIGNDDSLI